MKSRLIINGMSYGCEGSSFKPDKSVFTLRCCDKDDVQRLTDMQNKGVNTSFVLPDLFVGEMVPVESTRFGLLEIFGYDPNNKELSIRIYHNDEIYGNFCREKNTKELRERLLNEQAMKKQGLDFRWICQIPTHPDK